MLRTSALGTRAFGAVATAGSVVVFLVLGVGCAASVPGQAVNGSTQITVEEGDDMTPVTALNCGEPIQGLLNPRSELAMTGKFGSRIDRDGQGMFSGTVTVTATRPGISGVTSPEADVYLARDGEVVATPLAKDAIGEQVDVDPSAGAVFTAGGSILDCGAGSGEMLPAGAYEIYAVVVVNQDDGSAVVSTGGPWPLEIR